jgi:hypothetical protein
MQPPGCMSVSLARRQRRRPDRGARHRNRARTLDRRRRSSALLRRAVRHRVAPARARDGAAARRDRARDRREGRLQVVLRQGKPLLARFVSRPGTPGGSGHPRGSETRDGAAGDLGRSRAVAGGGRRAGSRRAPDPGVSLAADGPSRRGGANRQAPERQEGPVPRARRHGQGDREVPGRGKREGDALRARRCVRIPRPRRRHAVVRDHAEARLSDRLRRDALAPASRGREGDRRVEAVRATTIRSTPSRTHRRSSTYLFCRT